MKKFALVCTMLAALCYLAYAGTIETTAPVSKETQTKTIVQQTAPTVPVKADGSPMNTTVIKHPGVPVETGSTPVVEEDSYVKEEIANLEAQLQAMAEAGVQPDPTLKERLSELLMLSMPANRPTRSLDQGGGDCATAVVIDPGSLPFCDSGVLDDVDDCVGRPFNDVFYSFTPAVTDTYRFSTCGSDADTYIKLWGTACCSGTYLTTCDDECGGADAAKDYVLTAGTTYYFEVGLYTAAATGTPYNFNLYGPIDTRVPPNDLCADAITVSPGTTAGFVRAGTQDTGLPTCGGTTSFYKGVWYYFVGNGAVTTITTNNNCTNFNTRITVWEGDCANLVCVGGNDDISAYPGNSLSVFEFCAVAGTGYYILVSNTTSTTTYGGEFVMDITEGNPCAGPVGRCCYGDDPHNPLCDNLDEQACLSLGGAWDLGLTCTANPCARTGRCCYGYDVDPYNPSCVMNYTAECTALGGTWNVNFTCNDPCPVPPPNDACVDAIALTLPGSAQVNNQQAFNDAPGTCGTSAPYRGVWYTVVGDGNTITATTCNAYTTFDTKIQVFCGRCDALVCVTGNDDNCTAYGSLLSTATWCSIAGETYFIHVGSYSSTGFGDIELDVSSDGVACDNATSCCIVDFTVTAPGTWTGNTCGAIDDCDLPSGYGQTGAEEYVYRVTIPYTALWTVSLCGSGYDTELGVGTTCCNDDVCWNDDYCGLQSECNCLDLAAGTYYVTVSGYFSSCGDYILNIQPCTPPTGRCCYGSDPFNPQCADITEDECLALGGTWDLGLNCTDNPCPTPIIGDDCNTPRVIGSLPYTDTYSTCGATNDYDYAASYCLTYYYDNGPDIIYELDLTAPTCIVIDLTQGAYQYASVSLWDACPDQGTDHAIACAQASTDPLHIPCTPLDPGTYYIMVDNWPSPPCTDYTLTVTQCACPSPCEDWLLCGTPGETEPNDVCATQVDPYVIGCDALVFGKICPETDHDFFQVVVPPMTIMSLSTFDDQGCQITNPMACVQTQFWYDDCTFAAGPTAYNWTLTNDLDQPWTVYLDVYALAGCQATYKITTTCCEITDYCANPILIGGPQYYQATVNTCCATNVVPNIGSDCATTYTSGNDVIFRFTLAQDCNIDSIHVFYDGADPQWMLGTDCSDMAGTCVASADDFGAGGAEVRYNIALTAGTYYLSVSRYSTACGPLTVTIAADCFLPVDFLGADLVAGDRALTLNWATASETNTDRYEVVRDNIVVGRVDAAGTSSERHDYSWTETGLENGMAYTYTLRSVDVSGAVHNLATVTGSPSFDHAVVNEYALHQNYPNPFNPTTSLAFDLKDAGFVNLRVYNLMGQEVASVVKSEMGAGRHIVSFNAGSLSSGIYLYRLEVNGFVAEKKMLLMK